MAWYFGINVGDNEYTAVNQSTATSKDIEVVINTNANVPSTQDLLNSLEKLHGAILRAGKAW